MKQDLRLQLRRPLMSKIKYLLFTLSIVFITLGILREEMDIVLKKAINICLECIGVG